MSKFVKWWSLSSNIGYFTSSSKLTTLAILPFAQRTSTLSKKIFKFLTNLGSSKYFNSFSNTTFCVNLIKFNFEFISWSLLCLCFLHLFINLSRDRYECVDPTSSYKLCIVIDKGLDKWQRLVDKFRFQVLLSKSCTKGIWV